tara:strand:+ start:340 stop:1137 length:798 start_codon:yes stop_codon:yes gene_type:complete
MKNFLVIGQPIGHSLSPAIHNYWIKKHNLDAIYRKKEISKEEIGNLIKDIKEKKIDGANVTVPFKKDVIPYLDQLTSEAENTQSVNTIYLDNKKLIGHNTDITGFERSIKKIKYDLSNKEVLILGSGGVVPSIIFALKNMKISKITLTNRTKEKAKNLTKLFENINIVDWGIVPNFDVIINATSIGLNKNDELKLDFNKSVKNKFFYDVIYNPSETNFLKTGKKLGNITENGKMMFVYQAIAAFKIWHGIEPEIDDMIIKILEND